MNPIRAAIFDISPDVRYVATYLGGELEYSQRPGLAGASSSESDKYEELIVNPTLLKLVTQRGNIDCGGAAFVIIRYGNFWETVVPVANGHISVGVAGEAEVTEIAGKVSAVVAR
jgi:hypothetical protein